MKDFFNTMKPTHALLLLAVVLVTFAACQQEEDYLTGDPRPAVSAYGTNSNVMIVNASPGAKQPAAAAPVVNLRVNNVVVTNTATPPVALDYSYLNTPTYRGVLATPQTQIRFVNKDGGASVGASNFSIVPNTSYTVFLLDSTTRSAGQRVVQVTDVLTAPAAGKVRVRFLHFSPNAPEVIVVNNTGAPVTPPTLFSARRYNELTRRVGSTTLNFGNFTEIDAGTYDLDVRLTDVANTSVLPLNGVTFTAGKIYTVYARGFVGGAAGQELGATIILHN
jgi:hypothetical protein